MEKALATTCPLIAPLGYLLAGALLGWALDRLLMALLRRLAARVPWNGEVVAPALRGMLPLWGLAGGAYAAVLASPAGPSARRLATQLLVVTAILSLTVVAARITAALVTSYGNRTGGYLASTSIFSHIMRGVVVAVGILIALQTMGISVTPVLTAMGIGGLAVALALQDTLSNLFAGLHILASRQIRPGDYVRLDSGHEGTVTDITWRDAVLLSPANSTIIVPNSALASATVTNFSRPQPELWVPVEGAVSYASDLAHVQRVVEEVARQVMREVEGGVPDADPAVRFHTFADSSINFRAVLRAAEFGAQHPLRHEFIKRLHVRFAQEGIEIPFPIRTVYLHQGSGRNGQE